MTYFFCAIISAATMAGAMFFEDRLDKTKLLIIGYGAGVLIGWGLWGQPV